MMRWFGLVTPGMRAVAIMLLAMGLDRGDVRAQSGPLERLLSAEVRPVHWQNAPLVPALSRFARLHKVTLFVDRRVDPEQPLDGSFSNIRLDALFRKIAQERGLGVSAIDEVVYIGPANSAQRLRIVQQFNRDVLIELSASRRRALSRRSSQDWPFLSNPRQLVEQVCREFELDLMGLDRIPHDLWPAGDWPPMDCVDQLTLLLVGFDLWLTWDIDAEQIGIVPIDDRGILSRLYRRATHTPQRLRALAKTADGQLELAGNRVLFHGTLDQHREFTDLLAGPRPRTHPKENRAAPATLDRYTVTVTEERIDLVLRQLAGQLELTIETDDEAVRAAKISLEELTSFKVEQATLDELLRAALNPVGLDYRRSGRLIRIVPRQADVLD